MKVKNKFDLKQNSKSKKSKLKNCFDQTFDSAALIKQKSVNYT